jgi:uncharacterized protein YbjT (DUF2867 family)
VISRVLVAGGTGRLGTVVIEGLAARGLSVRVMTRDRQRAAHLAGRRVEVVTGDVGDPATVTAAAAGIDVVVSAVQGFAGRGGGSPATVDRDGNLALIRAAEAAGAEMVLMSVVGVAPDSPFELFRMKHAAEAALADSGLSATVVRATAFVELWISLLAGTAGRSNRPLVFGRGHNPINFVSVRDVAALVEHVVTDRATRGHTEQIGGPDNLTMTELARMVSAHRGGSPTEPRHVPPAALRAMAATIGRLRPALGRQARAALAMDTHDLTFHPGIDVRDHLGDIPRTSAAQVLQDLPTVRRPPRDTATGRPS